MVKSNDRMISNDAYVELIFDNKVSYEMNDKGNKGDAVPGDGYYSMILPDVLLPGEYDVNIKFSWPNFGSSISEICIHGFLCKAASKLVVMEEVITILLFLIISI